MLTNSSDSNIQLKRKAKGLLSIWWPRILNISEIAKGNSIYDSRFSYRMHNTCICLILS